MKMKTLVSATIISVSANTMAGAINVDVIGIVDESGSMSTEHAWIDNAILALQAELQVAAGSDPLTSHYGLTGFGGNSANTPNQEAQAYDVGTGLLGSAQEFADSANANLTTSGGFEDGYEAIRFVFDTYTFTDNAAKNFILITDEDRDIQQASTDDYNTILSSLQSTNTLLNAVINCYFYDTAGNRAIGIDKEGNAYVADGNGGFTKENSDTARTRCSGTSETDYVDLALASGGAAWDLNILRNGGDDAVSFTNAFTNIKVQEIVDQNNQVPVPAGLALVGLGFVALRLSRKIA